MTYSFVATPILDFIPIAEEIMFTEGQSSGASECVDIMIIQDVFVEQKEIFEVLLLPNPQDLFAVFIKPGSDRALVSISDGENDRSIVAVYSKD